MDLFAVVDQVIELLRSRGRVSYRALRVQFNLDDEALEARKSKRGLQENNCTYPLDLPALAGRFNPATGSCKQLTTHSHATSPLSPSKAMEPFFKRHPFVSSPVEQLLNVPVFPATNSGKIDIDTA
jgi:hypothetical protein